MLIGAYMTGEPLENGSIIASKSKFDTKIEESSAKMYFHYYGQLLHQQNMLQDFVRTGNLFAGAKFILFLNQQDVMVLNFLNRC